MIMSTAMKATRVDGEHLAQVFASKIGIPCDEWYGRCHQISLAIVRTGMIKGPRGARVRVARGFHPSVPMRQHSWISIGDPYSPTTRYMDPTLWCWTGNEPSIWDGLARKSDHTPHGTGTIWEYGQPVHQGGTTIELTPAKPLSAAALHILDMIGPLDVPGWMALANAPVGGWPAREVFEAIAATEALSAEFIPIDVRGMLFDENVAGLYW
jgi:hypothetical protein